MAGTGRLRIGELSRRVGESPELLRAWETRYGLVAPARSPGGLRLYSERDVKRIQAMQGHIAAGLSASEAARLVRADDGAAPNREADSSLAEIETALESSFEALDEAGAQAALDRLLLAFGLEYALSTVILPFLGRLGDRWAAAEASVAEEHFASNVIGGRLRSLARGWDLGVGPRAVLACPPGEHHELGLLSFGLALRERGWRITYLGAQTPIGELLATLDRLRPAIVVLAAVVSERYIAAAGDLRALAARVRVVIGGAGASPELAGHLGAEWLGDDAIVAAAQLLP